MSLSTSKILKMPFHTPETRTIIAENPLDIENQGHNYLNMTLMARIIHPSVKSLPTHFFLENKLCFSFLSITYLHIFLFALSHLEIFSLGIFSNETNILQKDFPVP